MTKFRCTTDNLHDPHRFSVENIFAVLTTKVSLQLMRVINCVIFCQSLGKVVTIMPCYLLLISAMSCEMGDQAESIKQLKLQGNLHLFHCYDKTQCTGITLTK